jgi:hypothetical protein
MGKEEIKQKDGGVNLRYIVSAFVNVTVYPQYNYNMLMNKCFKWMNSQFYRGV